MDSSRVVVVQQRSDPDVAALVRAHQAEVWRYLRYLGASGELADDLTQETFLTLLRAPYEDRGPEARSGWLRTVARNLFLKAVRKPPLPMTDVETIDAIWTGFTREDGGAESLTALRACLLELDGRARQAIALHYEQRKSRSAIGKELGIGEDGVKSLLRRVRAVLRACVERRLSA
ncbi:MAG: sigma-70 family RNA polymerase sigma factor [Planctomycetes bacterium]|nr:sigma-70 family RNA polymerase sigma factor [Planctomycetota bacterium]